MKTPELFRQVLSQWATGVTVVTTAGDGAPYGLTVSSFSSVSLDPMMVLVCLDNRLSGLDHFKKSGNFGVSILAEGQQEISGLFARKGTERPPALYFNGPSGIPLIREALAVIECKTAATYPGGDHTIFLGEVLSLEVQIGRAHV